jgi:hypothetical protein
MNHSGCRCRAQRPPNALPGTGTQAFLLKPSIRHQHQDRAAQAPTSQRADHPSRRGRPLHRSCRTATQSGSARAYEIAGRSHSVRPDPPTCRFRSNRRGRVPRSFLWMTARRSFCWGVPGRRIVRFRADQPDLPVIVRLFRGHGPAAISRVSGDMGPKGLVMPITCVPANDVLARSRTGQLRLVPGPPVSGLALAGGFCARSMAGAEAAPDRGCGVLCCPG